MPFDRRLSASTANVRAAIYCRISEDRGDERVGVQGQEADLRREAARRGLDVVEVLVDNDLSGEGLVTRPQFDRLIELIEQRQIDAVLAIDLDRLIRGFAPYVRFYEACEMTGMLVVWLGGEASFKTGAGLLELEIRASFAREELRKIRARVKRRRLDQAQNGQDVGGPRAFGYEADRHTIRRAEADLVVEAARRALQREPLRSICADWNRRAVPTVRGRTPTKSGRRTPSGSWSTPVLKRLLMSARISGRRETYRNGEGKRLSVGEILGPAVWPGIITGDDSDKLRALLTDPDRRQEGYPREYLLGGGILRCGRVGDDGAVCGKPLHSRPPTRGGYRDRSYSCMSGPGFGGCGRIRIRAVDVEELVTEAVISAIEAGALVKAYQRADDREAMAELLGVEAKLAELAQDYASDRITRGEWERMRATLAERRERLSRRVEAARRAAALETLPDPLRSSWDSMQLHQKRLAITAVIAAVVVGPAAHPGGRGDLDRVAIGWRA
jgi:DNA invertase Pin-like site-specific DNA recombinase